MFRRIALSTCAALSFGSVPAYAGTALIDPPILLGAGPHRKRPVVLVDPRLPSGSALAAARVRPVGTEPPACSFREPVCVHRGAGVSAENAVAALSALENAYQKLVGALLLPAPLRDAGQGGSDALDLYLDRTSSEFASEHDPPEVGGFDSASAYCQAGVAEAPALERTATLCIGEAIAWRLDASAAPHTRRAFATELWWIVGLPTSLDVQAVDDVQARPELAIMDRELSASSEGAALFFDFLETTRSTQAPGALSTALLWLTASRTEPDAARWNDSPDVLDVLRHSLDEDPTRIASLFGDFARARTFLGDRNDGLHAPFLDWAGAFARPRYDWLIAFSSLPRRVKSGRPIESSGMELVWLDLDQAPIGAALGFEAEWEAPVAFHFSLVSIDAQGREMARVEVPFQERGRSAEGRVVNLTGVRAILVIGINVGGVDLTHPFDPDLAPFEPHACTIYLVAM